MLLKETDWDAPGGATEVEVDYPAAPITDLVNWLRRTTAWFERPELVEQRVRKLNGILADHRANPSAAVSVPSLLGRMADPAFREEVERALKEYRAIQGRVNRAAALERARDAKAAKKAAEVAG